MQCGVTYDLNGPTASNTATPAQLATAEAAVAAANAATIKSSSSSSTMPLLAAPVGAPTLFTSAAPQLRVRHRALFLYTFPTAMDCCTLHLHLKQHDTL